MPPRTISEVLKWTTEYFTSHQVEGPRLSAELLLAHALKASRLDLYLRFDQPLAPEELAGYRELIRRRLRREPVSYITGSRPFWEMTVEVTPDVLIPRADTETLVETALDDLSRMSAAAGRPLSIFEPATGSGAVVLSLAAARPEDRFFASDISPPALRVAVRNARRVGLAGRVCFFSSDWFAALNDKTARFDLIAVNPPYVAAADILVLAPEIRDYEPRQALDGGEDGLDHVRHIIPAAGQFLTDGGLMLMEIGWDQRDRVRGLAEKASWCREVVFIKDLSGHDRVARLWKKA